MKLSFVIVFSLAIGALAAALLSRLGLRLGLGDVPGRRSSHDRTVPKGGGVGIPLSVAVIGFTAARQDHLLVGLALILSAIAFFNDRRELAVSLRLFLEFLFGAALVLYARRDLLAALEDRHGVAAAAAGLIFFTLYIVAATNFFNFMDGINGLAGLEAIASFVILGVAAVSLRKSGATATLAFSAAAAAAGFLVFNFPKARVFMGDVGSIFAGFLFAGLVTSLAGDAREFLLFSLFQAVFYVDCLSTIFIRLLRGENIFQSHRKHLYQRLVHDSGWTHARVALVYVVAQIIVSGLGCLLFRYGLPGLALLWGVVFLVYQVILIRRKFVYI